MERTPPVNHVLTALISRTSDVLATPATLGKEDAISLAQFALLDQELTALAIKLERLYAEHGIAIKAVCNATVLVQIMRVVEEATYKYAWESKSTEDGD